MNIFFFINKLLSFISFSFYQASHDLVRNVHLVRLIEDSQSLKANTKSVNYHISWFKPLKPNGLVYFYMIYIGQDIANGPKEERCVGHDIYSINVTLLPKTVYRLKIITYTIARLNNEYNYRGQINDVINSLNTTNLYYELNFTTHDLAGRPNRKS